MVRVQELKLALEAMPTVSKAGNKAALQGRLYNGVLALQGGPGTARHPLVVAVLQMVIGRFGYEQVAQWLPDVLVAASMRGAVAAEAAAPAAAAAAAPVPTPIARPASGLVPGSEVFLACLCGTNVQYGALVRCALCSAAQHADCITRVDGAHPEWRAGGGGGSGGGSLQVSICRRSPACPTVVKPIPSPVSPQARDPP